MRRGLVILIACLLLMVPGLLFAAGQPEPEVEDLVQPVDPDSEDMLLAQGLPAVRDREVDLEFLTIFSGDGYRSLRAYLDDIFEMHYPNISVDAQETESGDLHDIVSTRVAAGNPPPVVHSAGSYFILPWAEEGALVDVTDIWDEYNLHDIIPEGTAASFRYDGRYYGLPLSTGMNNIVYYNLNLIREAGVAEPPYESWDELFEVAEEYVAATGEPFWIGGYSPDWFGMSKTIMLAASYYGPELYARVLNGEATEQDFVDALSFHKRLYDVGNPDYMSMNSITGGVEAAARGDGVVATAGGWGYPRFANAGLELGVEWTMDNGPGHDVMIATPSGMVAFRDSGYEEEAIALMLSGVLMETQVFLQPEQGNSPIRTDVDPRDFAEVGRYPVSQMSTEVQETATVMPRENAGLPEVIVSEYSPVFSAFFAGDLSVEEAAEELVSIQEERSDSFAIEWDFGL